VELIVNAEYGAVLATEEDVYYVPTKTPDWQIRAPAKTEKTPILARETVLEPSLLRQREDSLRECDLLEVDGTISFTGERKDAIGQAVDWAQIEELVGPLRYREDVEQAAMYMEPGICRPRVPVRVARHGLGAIAVYLWAHGHDGWSVAKALTLTYAELDRLVYKDVYTQTPSFQWEGFEYE